MMATKETNAKRVIDNVDIDNQVNNHETLFGSAAGSNNEENDSGKDNDELGCITIQHDDLQCSEGWPINLVI